MANSGSSGANLGFKAQLSEMADPKRGFRKRLVLARELRAAT
jgi:hypothetical protein